jgi:hypothetical protein
LSLCAFPCKSYTICRYMHAESNTGRSNKTSKPVLMCAEWLKRSCVAFHKSDKRQVRIDIDAGYNVANRRRRRTSAWYHICNCWEDPRGSWSCIMRETDCQPETRDAMVFLSVIWLYLYLHLHLHLFQAKIAGWLLAALWPRLSCESSPDRQTLLWPSRGATS